MENQFRTIIKPPPARCPINHRSSILMLGSCFAENIGSRLIDFHFPVCLNPSGPLYNPISICSALDRLLVSEPYTRDELFLHEGLWHSFDHHSSYSMPDSADSLLKINSSMKAAGECLKDMKTIILTFGSAMVYRLREESGKIVANCHKLPHSRFDRSLTSINSIVECCGNVLKNLLAKRPDLSVILTVSPVRHLRDDPHENAVSKAHLMSAVWQLEQSFPCVYYFPAFEIMMDDLRDYRFYNRDMVHPGDIAIDYLWEQFAHSCIADESKKFISEFKPICAAFRHRVIQRSHDANMTFAVGMLKKIEELQNRYPHIALKQEYSYFSQLKSGSEQNPETQK